MACVAMKTVVFGAVLATAFIVSAQTARCSARSSPDAPSQILSSGDGTGRGSFYARAMR